MLPTRTSWDPRPGANITMKMLVAFSAGHRRCKLKADVGTAYGNARTSRGIRAVRCPATCREMDSDGMELVLVIIAPLFGEPEAGREWQDTLAADLIEIGCLPTNSRYARQLMMTC